MELSSVPTVNPTTSHPTHPWSFNMENTSSDESPQVNFQIPRIYKYCIKSIKPCLYPRHICTYSYTKLLQDIVLVSDCDLVSASKGLESRRLLFKTITCHHPLCFGCGCTFLFLSVSCFPVSEKAQKRWDP